MKTQDLNALAHKVSSFISQLDMDDVRDDLLARANLRRRRPVMMSASAIGLVGLGALAAFATVALIPQVRNFFTGEGDKLTNKAEKAADKAKSIAEDAKDDAKEVASRIGQSNGPRVHGRS